MRENKSRVDERCASCKYRGHLRSGERGVKTTLICDYINIIGLSRGCPAGAACDKYEPHDGKGRRTGIVITKRDQEPRGWWSND